MKKIVQVAFAAMLATPMLAQPSTNGVAATKKSDTKTAKQSQQSAKDKPVTTKGLFTVTQQGGEWTFEIPKNLLGRKFLSTVRYTSTPAGTGTYGGELSNEQMVYFEEAPDDRLLLRAEPLSNIASKYEDINKAVLISSSNPILGTFKIESRDKGMLKVKVTQFFSEDNPALGVSVAARKEFGIAGMLPGQSYIEGIKTFPTNTEIRLVRTYATPQGKSYSSYTTGRITLGLNISFVLLPETPMLPRLFDPRVGYFVENLDKFSDYQQKVQSKRYITRWRLEPKDSADMEKMKRGELVEPKKPIVYYIDPATPKRWRKYLIQGVNDWQVAFEQAGFKNAIRGEEWPDTIPEMSMEDARFSVIRYLASDIPNAYGPNVHDPRSGEIMESHICWYHNVMTLVHDWYMIQAGTLDEAARHPEFDEELMGQLIRFVSSHEVGHTLGLRHNFGSSSTVPVDSLRNKAWVEKHGHTPSIMDYARFNFVAQPEDGISRAGLFPRIGDYDKWAIQWGYTPMFDAYDDESDYYELQKLMNTKDLTSKSRLWFGDGETRRYDPRCLSEDLGDDAVKMAHYGLLNLKRIAPQLEDWNYSANDINSENLRSAYNNLVGQFNRYVGHVSANIGGFYNNYKTVNQPGEIFGNVSKAHSLRALNAFDEMVLTEPTWLINVPYIRRISIKPETITNSIGVRAVKILIERAGMLNETFPVADYVQELSTRLFRELDKKENVSGYRRQLQSTYVSALVAELPNQQSSADFRAAILFTLRNLQAKLKANVVGDATTRAHYASLTDLIARALEVK